jgi:hypothetical protein
MTDQPGVAVAGVAMPFRWHGQPAEADVTDDGVVAVAAGPRTDFADPGTGELTLSAPALLATAD